MIPKKIHYCWYGPKPIPRREQAFIKNWKVLMPQYEFHLWSEENLPSDVPYLNTAYAQKNWANVSNYMRLYALKKLGGIYLDTDMEVRKSFDLLLKYNCFLGIEFEKVDRLIANNAVLGAKQGHWFVSELLDAISKNFDGTEQAHLSSPMLTTKLLESYGFQKDHPYVEGLKIFPQYYFYPYHFTESALNAKLTENTYTIHHWSSSWTEDSNWDKRWRRIKLDIKWILARLGLYKTT
ncbi:MAG: glycosyltransferase [Bacteroidota bacterium]